MPDSIKRCDLLSTSGYFCPIPPAGNLAYNEGCVRFLTPDNSTHESQICMITHLQHSSHSDAQRLEREHRVAVSLRETLRVLNSNRSLDEILQFIVRQAREILYAQAAAIYRPVGQSDIMPIQAHHGLSEQYVREARIPVGRLATGNAHKAAEFAELWPDARVSGGPDGHSVEETGTTFLQNAWIKAAALRPLAAPDAIVMADDSGLAVTALGGRPGVFSARYAGPDADDAANCARLLDELGDGDDRRAAFVCVLVALTPDERMLVASGCCDGRIAPALRERMKRPSRGAADSLLLSGDDDRRFLDWPRRAPRDQAAPGSR